MILQLHRDITKIPRYIVETIQVVGTVYLQGRLYNEPDIQMLAMRVYAQVFTYLSISAEYMNGY